MKKILTAALLATVATSAFAADLPTRKAPPPPPVYAPPPFSWTGFYVGVNGGYGFGSPSSGSAFGDPAGGVVGGQVGYNYQINQFVLGVEGDLDWADLSKTNKLASGATTNFKLDALGHALGRAGFAWDRMLFYAAGGLATGDMSGSFDGVGAAAKHYSNSLWQSGWAVGGGVEYALTNNISLKGQYLFSELNDKTFFAAKATTKTGMDINQVTAGINYKF